MKKILNLLVVFLMASGVLADTDKENTMGIDAQMRFRYFFFNLDGNDDTDFGAEHYFSQRFLLEKDFHINHQLKGRLALIHTSLWGDNSWVETSRHPNAATPDRLARDNALLINEAYGRWAPFDELHFRVGRGTFDLNNGTVISSNDFQEVPTTFDHILVAYHHESFRIDFWYTELANFLDDTMKNRHSGFFTLNADLSNIFTNIFDFASVHLIYAERNASVIDETLSDLGDTSDFRYGIAIAGASQHPPRGLDYKLAVSGHRGTLTHANGDTEGFMVDLKAGYTFHEWLNLRIFAGFHLDSGDDDGDINSGSKRYDSFFYNFHDNAGEMDILQWGNLVYWNVGLTLQPIDHLTVGLAYFMFQAAEANDGFHAQGGGSRGISQDYWSHANNGSKELGSEIDVWATKSFGRHLGFSFTYSLFIPGDYFAAENGTSYDPSSRFLLQACLKF